MDESDRLDAGARRPLAAGRLALTAVVGVVLLAAVAVASRAERSAGGEGGDDAGAASTVLVNAVVLVLAVLVAAIVVGVLFAFATGSPAPDRRGGRRVATQLIALFTVVGALILLASRADLEGLLRGADDAREEERPAKPLDQRDARGDGGDAADVYWLPVLLVFGAALVAFSVVGASALRRYAAESDASESTLAERLSNDLEETLDDLYRERDARRAVIAAYVRMERTLAAHGLPRRRAEAPHEYVGRMLADITASAPSVQRLTRLFERARFSQHPIGADMKDEAIAALAAVRDELRARDSGPLAAVPS